MLEDSYYYIEACSAPVARFMDHLEGKGCKWTRIHKPLRIQVIHANVDISKMDEIIIEYMSEKGIQKVRGGKYNRVDLTFLEKYMLQAKVWQEQGRCTKCGRTGHPMKYCNYQFDINAQRIDYLTSIRPEWFCHRCNKGYTNEWECENHTKSCTKTVAKCIQCGDHGHYAHQCGPEAKLDPI